MAWNTVAVDAPASQVKIDFEAIPDDVKDGVEEMFAGLAPDQRGVVGFENETARNMARAQVRAYCEKRPDGRLTASIWAGFTDPEGKGEFRAKAKDDKDLPALSLAFTVYVKKEKTEENGQTSS